MNEPPEWHVCGLEQRLDYRGYTLVVVEPEDGAVRVRTRCYSSVYQQSRLLATMEGGRRYGDAWLRKWGPQAILDVNNKIGWIEGDARRRQELEELRARGELDKPIPVPKYRPCKRRRQDKPYKPHGLRPT